MLVGGEIIIDLIPIMGLIACSIGDGLRHYIDMAGLAYVHISVRETIPCHGSFSIRYFRFIFIGEPVQ